MIVKTTERIAADLVYPLDLFYAGTDLPVPEVERVEGELLPEPARTLLVHEGDMTPTLESFYGSRMRLKKLASIADDEAVLRRVVLFDDRGRMVEFGAIRIELPRYPLRAQAQIREGRVPLGAILDQHHIVHRSRPRGYFRVRADALMRDALRFEGDPMLYGRRNAIVNHADQPLADVVEILPPIRER